MRASSSLCNYFKTNVKNHSERITVLYCTHHHLKMQQTEREERKTWVRGCPHDLLRWDQRLKPELIRATLQASQVWGACVCVECVCSTESGLICGAYREPLTVSGRTCGLHNTHSCSHLHTRTQAFPDEWASGTWARHNRDATHWLCCPSFHMLIQRRGPFTCV